MYMCAKAGVTLQNGDDISYCEVNNELRFIEGGSYAFHYFMTYFIGATQGSQGPFCRYYYGSHVTDNDTEPCALHRY
jgi:hypothetical protein